jgi:predicted nucleic acid-binding protein
MIFLVDTNVLLRSIQQVDPMHPDAKRAAAILTRQSQHLSIVAAMKVHNVTHLLTFNTDDSKRFSEITVVNPQNIT